MRNGVQQYQDSWILTSEQRDMAIKVQLIENFAGDDLDDKIGGGGWCIWRFGG